MDADQGSDNHDSEHADGDHHPGSEANPPVVRIHFHTVTFCKRCGRPNLFQLLRNSEAPMPPLLCDHDSSGSAEWCVDPYATRPTLIVAWIIADDVCKTLILLSSAATSWNYRCDSSLALFFLIHSIPCSYHLRAPYLIPMSSAASARNPCSRLWPALFFSIHSVP